MAELKTKPTTVSVDAYIAKIADDGRRKDCKALVAIMKRVTKAKPVMWGPSIIGFGAYHYKYASGHEGDSCLAGFASRKDLTIYLMGGFPGHAALMKKLGKHKMSKACLYVKKLDDVDLGVLEELIRRSTEYYRDKYRS